MQSLAWSIGVPLAAAVACFASVPTGVILLLLAACGAAAWVPVWQLYAGASGAYVVGDWAVPLGIGLRLDGLSALFMGVTAVVFVIAGVHALAYRLPERRRSAFWSLWFLLWAGLHALYLSNDLFNLYVTLEVVGLSAVALVSLTARAAALQYLFVTMLGSLAYLLGVALLYAGYGALEPGALRAAGEAGPLLWSVLALMSVGLLLKTAVFPLHFWLPPAHAGAAGPVSAVLSALVVKASFFLLVRLWADLFQPVAASPALTALGLAGIASVLWGGWRAFRAERLKIVIAYSTVAQLGYLMIFFPLAFHTQPFVAVDAYSGMGMLVAAHACAKAGMFLAAGSVLHELGHDRLDGLDGWGVRYPVAAFAFAVGGVTLMGLPPSGGFVAKWLLLRAAFHSQQWLYAAALLGGGLLAATYVFRPLGGAFRVVGHVEKKMPGVLQWSALALAGVSLLLGVVAAWPLDLLEIGRVLETRGAP